MKKSICALLTILLIITGLFVFTGCNEKNEEKKAEVKEVEKYSVKTIDETGTITFEFEKNDKYKITADSNKITFKSSENYSEIIVTAIHDSVFSASIFKKEKDFYSSKFHDFKNVRVEEYSGWEVYEGEYGYKTVLVLNDKDENNNVYAVDVAVKKSPIMKENMTFDTEEFVKSEEFQNLVKSIKLELE